MTLNPPVNQQGHPLALPNQQFILWREQMEFKVSIDQVGNKSAVGTGYLTTFRIIFVSEKPTQQFFSFDIPIANLFEQKCEFPLFGSTYLKGSSKPYMNMLPGISHFKLYFKKGGCHTFIKVLSQLITQTRKNMQQQRNFMETQLYNDIRSGKFNFSAFVDPNDPSKIYTAQNQPQPR